MKAFNELGISEKVLKAIEDMGYEEPTRIQEEVVSVILGGKDVIAQAQTGTGKTAAFGMPLVDLINERGGLQGIIISPTRELAIQVAGEISKIGKYKRIREVAIYGGQPIDRQIRIIRQGVNVVVGTPGRILDHINRGTLDLSKIKYVILDEADEMLDMGFIEDIESILKNISTERQTMLFSATMPEEIRAIARRYMRSPEHISVMPREMTVSTIEQYYVNTNDKDKLDAFTRILDVNDVENGIVFCRTKKSVDELVESMQSLGYAVEGIHGDYNQTHRLNAINKFKDGTIDFLIATDVAARGLDIENVSHVFNYHIPEDPESYVHRIGRTGRAGKSGIAITFVSPREFRLLKDIERYTKSRIKTMSLPKPKDILETKITKLKKTVYDAMDEEHLRDYIHIAEDLAEESNLLEVCAAALRIIFEKENRTTLNEIKEMKVSAPENQLIRMFLNIGKEQSMNKKDIVGGLAFSCDIRGEDIYDIDIYEKFTFINVSQHAARKIMNNREKAKIRGRKIRIEVAKSK